MQPKRASSGHKLGQIVGDWWEEYVILPLLESVATDLQLFLDSRFVHREVRSSSKILWPDEDGNEVDYDFVLEVGGTTQAKGVPVGFIESFWRRGARHSKDKARDDTNKLLPMRSAYPTARFLSIAACGEFTNPARDYVRTRNVDLFYIPKNRIVEAFQANDLVIDYNDQVPERDKAFLVAKLIEKFNGDIPRDVSISLNDVCGKAVTEGYKDRIRSALSALPVEIRIIEAQVSTTQNFNSIEAVNDFLKNPKFDYDDPSRTYKYVVSYSDGSCFETDFLSLFKITEIHNMTSDYVKHIGDIKK